MRAGFSICAAIALAGCLQVEPMIEQSASKGDFSFLNCGQLAVAEGSIRQRLSTLGGNDAFFGVVTPSGVPVAQRRNLLEGAADDIREAGLRQECPASSTIVTASEVLTSPEIAEPAADAAPSEAGFPFAGRMMQVGTFEIGQNRDRVLAHFRSRGLKAASAPTSLGGVPHSRVLVGPIRNADDIRAIDKAARELGLNDSFFADG